MTHDITVKGEERKKTEPQTPKAEVTDVSIRSGRESGEETEDGAQLMALLRKETIFWQG